MSIPRDRGADTADSATAKGHEERSVISSSVGRLMAMAQDMNRRCRGRGTALGLASSFMGIGAASPVLCGPIWSGRGEGGFERVLTRISSLISASSRCDLFAFPWLPRIAVAAFCFPPCDFDSARSDAAQLPPQ
jgi:hypothetical protein